MAAKKKVDYDRIEPDWRAGIKSREQLAAEYTQATGVSVSGVAIKKHFEKQGIGRDLKAKIRAKAEAMVSESMVTGKVSAERIANDKQIVEVNAQVSAEILVGHRATANRMRSIGLSLLSELEGQGADLASLQALGEMLRSPDERGQDKLNDLYQKIISTPGRIDGAKKVAETLKIAIGLEREAYGLSADTKPPSSYEQSLQELAG